MYVPELKISTAQPQQPKKKDRKEGREKTGTELLHAASKRSTISHHSVVS
jgi:hypothetical protein